LLAKVSHPKEQARRPTLQTERHDVGAGGGGHVLLPADAILHLAGLGCLGIVLAEFSFSGVQKIPFHVFVSSWKIAYSRDVPFF